MLSSKVATLYSAFVVVSYLCPCFVRYALNPPYFLHSRAMQTGAVSHDFEIKSRFALPPQKHAAFSMRTMFHPLFEVGPLSISFTHPYNSGVNFLSPLSDFFGCNPNVLVFHLVLIPRIPFLVCLSSVARRCLASCCTEKMRILWIPRLFSALFAPILKITICTYLSFPSPVVFFVRFRSTQVVRFCILSRLR